MEPLTERAEEMKVASARGGDISGSRQESRGAILRSESIIGRYRDRVIDGKAIIIVVKFRSGTTRRIDPRVWPVD